MRTRASLLLAGLPLLGVGQVTLGKSGYTIRVKPTVGKKYNFITTAKEIVKIAGDPQQSIKAPVSMRIISRSGDRFRLSYAQGPITMNGKKLEDYKEVDGVLDTRMTPVSGIATMGPLSGFYPLNPVPLGKSWKAPFDLGREQKAEVTFTFVRITTRKGRKVAELKLSVRGAAMATGAAFIRVDDGLPDYTVFEMPVIKIQQANGMRKESQSRMRLEVIRL
ncbi:MAG: hypothetical protein JST35_01880 [Armatimonadetes bacterium]|nr:hypothetical protein [Armatimonadota bacterium]